MPSTLILLSPFLDITLQNPALQAIDLLDPFLGIDGLIKARKSYAGDTIPDHYLLSRVNGSQEGLPDIPLSTGAHDILVADARRWKTRMEKHGKPIHYYKYKEMIHAWIPLNFPESRRAREQITAIIDACDVV